MVFDTFEKGASVIALSGWFYHEGHEDHEEGKILDRINRIELTTNFTNSKRGKGAEMQRDKVVQHKRDLTPLIPRMFFSFQHSALLR